MGALGGVTMWFAGEVFSFLLRLICKGISKSTTHDGRDIFDEIIGPSRTLRLLQYAKDFIINKMIDYIKSTQKNMVQSIEQSIDTKGGEIEEDEDNDISSFVVVDGKSNSIFYI